MVKPALGYLDVLADVRDAVDVPVAAYNVSGEYAMVEAAAANGWINRDAAIAETLTASAGPVPTWSSPTGPWSLPGRRSAAGDHRAERGCVRARQDGDPRRGELPGAGVPGRRRHAAVHRPGPGPVPLRPGRQRTGRPDLLLGSDAARPRPPRGPGRRSGRRRARHLVRRPHPGRGRPGRGDHRPHAGRAGAAGQQRHRGHHVGAPAGPRHHRPGQDHQVRRLLPRPRRRPAGRRRLRRGDAVPSRRLQSRRTGHPRLTRRHRGDHRRHDRAALQRPGRGPAGLRRATEPRSLR